MKLRIPAKSIQNWAVRYVYPRQESELISLKQEIKSVGFITKNQLRLIANWKSPRSAGHIEKNTDNYIREITKWSFTASEERSKIEVLTLLDGVQWPSASVILHLFSDNDYPILDFRALWSVQSKVPPKYDFAFWWRYVMFCREIAQKNGISMRVLDRALWQYSKDHQK